MSHSEADHAVDPDKRTGVSFLFLLFAGVLTMLVRAQLAVPDNDLLSAETCNQVFTLHGSVVMVLFGMPISKPFRF